MTDEYETARQLRETLKHFNARLNSERGLDLAFAFICSEIDKLKKEVGSHD